MTPNEPIVIVGAGQCGLKAAETLRASGHDGGIVLIGEEPHPPYQRPPLSKAFLKGELARERLWLKAEGFYADQRIETRFGERVARIDPDGRRVELGDGMSLRYSRLLLATGTRARRIRIEGAELKGVFSLREIADVEWLVSRLETGMHVAIVGGGYIGLEVAAALRSAGFEITVIEGADRVMQRVVCPDVSHFFETLHREHGVSIHTSAVTRRILGTDHVTAVELDDGTTVPCDAVLVAVGAAPMTDLAEEAGLAIDNGILVDEACRTSAPDIYAAGDCAAFPSARYGRILRLESVQNAIDQAKAAARSMLGEEVSYDPLPWFWSDQYHVKLQIAGLSAGHDEVRIEGDPASGAFTATYLKDGRPICVDAINQPKAHMMARRSLAEGPAGRQAAE